METDDGLGLPMASLGFGYGSDHHHHHHVRSLFSSGPLGGGADSMIVKEEREARTSCQNGGGATSGGMFQNCRTPLQESLNYNTAAALTSPPRKKLAVDTSMAFTPLPTVGGASFDLYSPKGREDHSPNNNSNSSGGNNNSAIDSFKDSRRNRGGAGGGGAGAGGNMSRQQEELCLVCGDRASGYHYNALTCEGCKGFFRRSITKNAVYQCKYGNNCEIDMYMRRKCQECRLKKCLKVGMRPECVVPEYQCAVKREAKRAQKDKDKPNSTTKDGAGSPEVTNGVQSNSGGVGSGRGALDDDELTIEEEELIERIVFFQEEFESPSPEDLAKIAALEDIEGDDGEKQFKHITEITIFTIRLIVEFAKRVPWFDTLLREDQITLLKACSSEVMTLRSTRRYDVNTDCIVFANDQPYTRDNYRSAGLNDLPDPVFDFARKMCLMKTDNAEYALLTCIILFSDRPNLLEPDKVEAIQDIYLGALRKYVNGRRPKNSCMLARLLTTLTELRTLGSLNSEVCFSLKLQNKHLPAFLAEIWDVNS